MDKEYFMKEALRQAEKAYKIGETPIGAVIVCDGRIIARGYNKRETRKNSLMHAEIIAINRAAKKLGGWRLPRCSMYVTLEPCCMCSGAIIQSRIDNVYFGAYDPKSGCAGSVINMFEKGLFNHNVNIEGGIMEKECADILSTFFRELREKKRSEKI